MRKGKARKEERRSRPDVSSNTPVVSDGVYHRPNPVPFIIRGSERFVNRKFQQAQGENTAPYFAIVYESYRRDLNLAPDVLIVRIGNSSHQVERQLQQSLVSVNTFTFAGDYYALPNLIPLLTQPSRLELLLEILETPLPVREDR